MVYTIDGTVLRKNVCLFGSPPNVTFNTIPWIWIAVVHGVLLFTEKEEESCDSIGALFGNSPRTVSNWINRINERGDIESLRSKKQTGRPSRLSEEQRRACQRLFHKLGFSLKRARPVVARADEAKKAESKKTSRKNRKR